MSQMELRMGIDQAADECIIELHMNGNPLGHVRLPAPDLETFIHQLSEQRARMRDEVPRTLDPGARVKALVDPIWRVPEEYDAQGRLLCLRHPGLGWLAFCFPEHEAQNLCQWLAGHHSTQQD
jgi:hypothetical protein